MLHWLRQLDFYWTDLSIAGLAYWKSIYEQFNEFEDKLIKSPYTMRDIMQILQLERCDALNLDYWNNSYSRILHPDFSHIPGALRSMIWPIGYIWTVNDFSLIFKVNGKEMDIFLGSGTK